MKIHPYNGQFDDQIDSLVEAIKYKMAVHSDKGTWHEQSPHDMVAALKAEVDELAAALGDNNVLEAIHECGDIGAYAVMIIECLMRERSLKPAPLKEMP